MRLRRSRVRRAFTLVEILTSLAIMGIIGLAFVRLITSQARFTEGQMALRNARTVSRNAMNIMLTDIRMVQDADGLTAAARDSVTVRVPVAFGLLCATGLGSATMQIMPVDSAMTELAYYGGWAYRDSASGLFKYTNSASPIRFGSLAVTANPAAACTDSLMHAGGIQGPGILPMTYTTSSGTSRSSQVVTVNDGPLLGAPNPGWPVFIYQQITYRFDSSTAYPHRVGLFRKVRANNAAGFIQDEIIAPFDTSAKFRFYVLNADAATSTPPAPANLNTVRGLELVLAGSSPRAEQGKKSAQQALVTGVFFKNRRDP